MDCRSLGIGRINQLNREGAVEAPSYWSTSKMHREVHDGWGLGLITYTRARNNPKHFVTGQLSAPSGNPLLGITLAIRPANYHPQASIPAIDVGTSSTSPQTSMETLLRKIWLSILP